MIYHTNKCFLELEYRRIHRKYAKRRQPADELNFPSFDSAESDTSSSRRNVDRRNNIPSTPTPSSGSRFSNIRKSASMMSLPNTLRSKKKHIPDSPFELDQEDERFSSYSNSSRRESNDVQSSRFSSEISTTTVIQPSKMTGHVESSKASYVNRRLSDPSSRHSRISRTLSTTYEEQNPFEFVDGTYSGVASKPRKQQSFLSRKFSILVGH